MTKEKSFTGYKLRSLLFALTLHQMTNYQTVLKSKHLQMTYSKFQRTLTFLFQTIKKHADYQH